MIYYYKKTLKNKINTKEKPTQNIDSVLSKINFKQFLKVSIPMISLYVLIYYDVLLARALLSKNDSGVYASLNLVGSILFSLGGMIIPVFFVHMNEAYNKKEKMNSTLVYGFLAICAIVLLGLVVVDFVYPYIVSWLKPVYKDYLPQFKSHKL